ncbi:Membrane-bound mettalopeptidase, putative [Candida maltosa Xu316]|uniref:Peptide hydrolase n=1 Tax=Candida maltosa (strain Xu316) TaxID=1245528 RepID=M3K2A7_CANMX|nr:Membrane-bound mettalopeptidase, putative [Candida maltosa Xu316]
MSQEEVHESTSSSIPGESSIDDREPEHKPSFFIRTIRAIFGYRKTSLTLFVLLTIFAVIGLSSYDNNLDLTIDLPTSKLDKAVLDSSWLDLQNIARYPHTFGSHANDEVHDYLESRILETIKGKSYIEYAKDNDKVMYQSAENIVSYYESNNLLVRINGTDSSLPAFLLSAHYDSVPSSYGVTDDGMGIASLMGTLSYLSQSKQPKRTIIFNFNNAEEFGLHGAQALVSHPWFQQIKYFLNLEGTGAGGKAILFRGTDYGIVKYFDAVRYPYATSIFQQGFNNHLIHSETDYKVYKEAGLRGLDLAFYKPRDIYHTAEDNIRNINIKSLWHMLSNSIDFTKFITNGKIDDVGGEEFAIYSSFVNYFFAVSASTLVTINSVLLILFPLIGCPLLFIIIRYKKWSISTANFLSVPIALFLVNAIVLVIINRGFRYINQFLPSSAPMLIFATTTSISLLLYYLFLNTINFVSPSGDQKLVSIIEITFIYWLILIYTTKGLSQNQIGDDYTGEFAFTIIFLLEATASLFGLIGWVFTRSERQPPSGESEPLLNGRIEEYGSEDSEEIERIHAHVHENTVKHLMQHFGYDWSLQFLLIVPISSFVIYNSGWLVVDGINKSIQESLVAENFIYFIIQLFSQFWIIPFFPFIYKLNKFFILGLLAFTIYGTTVISFSHPFNQENPLKLRFIQKDGIPHVYGRRNTGISDLLSDIPSVKESPFQVNCEALEDGLEDCSYKTKLLPNILPGKKVKDYLTVEVVNKSSAQMYGLLSGEIAITVEENRMCNLEFPKHKVKAVIVYHDSPSKPKTSNFKSIPDGFSIDHGNYIYKNVSGIDQLLLNKLDWNENYHIGFQWLPNIDDDVNKINVKVDCFWADYTNVVGEGKKTELAIPAYSELLHYTPNWVTWANRDRGLVSVSATIEV